jgi:hypothetical protein
VNEYGRGAGSAIWRAGCQTGREFRIETRGDAMKVKIEYCGE